MNDFREYSELFHTSIVNTVNNAKGKDQMLLQKAARIAYQMCVDDEYFDFKMDRILRDKVLAIINRSEESKPLTNAEKTFLTDFINKYNDTHRGTSNKSRSKPRNILHSNDFREYSAAFHDRNDSIMHFGILGMKWGVRRYQNPDGTLTPAGKKRYDRMNNYADDVLKRYPNNLHAQKIKEKAKKYGTETPEEAEKRKELEKKETPIQKDIKKEGFKIDEYDRLYKKDGKDDMSLDHPYKEKENYKVSFDNYKAFKKDKDAHVKSMVEQSLKEFKKSNWDHSEETMNQLIKELKGASNAYHFESYPGLVMVTLGNGYELDSIGSHVFSFEYDLKTRKITNFAIEG